MVPVAVAALIALATAGGGTVGGYFLGRGHGRAQGQAAAAEAMADMAASVGQHVNEAVEHALAGQLQELQNQGLVAAADRRVECKLKAAAGAVEIYTCAIAVQQETCDESAVGANEQSACAIAIRTVDVMGRMLFCDAWADAVHAEGSREHEKEVESCLTRLGQ